MSTLTDYRDWPNGVPHHQERLHSAITQAIGEILAEWIADGRASCARDVGNGGCYEFAEDVMIRLGLDEEYVQGNGPIEVMETDSFWSDTFSADLDAIRAAGEMVPDDLPEDALSDLLGSATHQWLRFDGRHYDAATPEGRERFLDMPFFADQIASLRRKIAGDPAIPTPGM